MNWLWLFPAVGIAMLGVALALWQARRGFEADALRADGTVVALVHSRGTDSDGRNSDTWCPDVRFTTSSGQEILFTGSVCAKPAAYRVGEPVQVLYPPDDPQRASLAGFAERWLGPLMSAGIGTIFLLLGASFVVPPLAAHRRREALMRSGRPVMAQVTDVARNPAVQVQGRSPWRIHAQWLDPATRKVHVYESDDLWFDPTSFLGPDIRVLVDPRRPARYWMDTGSLPEQA